MLEIQRIRTEKESLIDGLKKRQIDATETLNQLLELDGEWRKNKTSLDNIAAELNALAKEIGDLFKTGKTAEANVLKEKTAALKVSESEMKAKVEELESLIQTLLYTLP
ncbi:MAG: serine--tRNA ligase, partial [Crocinitomicaceae bacterium]